MLLLFIVFQCFWNRDEQSVYCDHLFLLLPNKINITSDLCTYLLNNCKIYDRQPITHYRIKCTRFNERTLRELNAENEDITMRQRASRIQKWREAAQEAKKDDFPEMNLPDKLQSLECTFTILYHPLPIVLLISSLIVFDFNLVQNISIDFITLRYMVYYVFCCIILRNGLIIMALVPKQSRHGTVRECIVGLVSSVWRSGKKPQLSTAELDLAHVLAFRVIELGAGENPKQMSCNGTSMAWTLRVEALVAILGYDKVDNSNEKFLVTFNQESCKILEHKDELPIWWPEVSELKFNVFLPRQGRKRKGGKKNEKKNQEEQIAEAEETATNKKKKNKKGKKKTSFMAKSLKKKKKDESKAAKTEMGSEDPKKPKPKHAARLKPAKPDKPEIAVLPENFKKNGKGGELIRQEMDKLRKADQLHFSDRPLFDAAGHCRIRADKTEGVPWDHIVASAFTYFKARCLGRVFLWFSIYTYLILFDHI